MGLYFAWLGFYNQVVTLFRSLRLLIGIFNTYIMYNSRCWSFPASLVCSSSSTAWALHTLMISISMGELYNEIYSYIHTCVEIYRDICYEIYVIHILRTNIYWDIFREIVCIRGEICKKEVGNLTMCPECPQFCDFRFGWQDHIKEMYFISFQMY